MMNYFILDVEVYPEWFVIGFKRHKDDKIVSVTSDDISGVQKVVNLLSNRNNIITGYNIKGYDLPIVHKIITEYESKATVDKICNEAFNLSQAIIDRGERGYYPYNMCSFTDLQDDMLMGFSLKEYESNRGLAIDETPVPWGTRNLTQAQKDSIIYYNNRDLDATDDLLEYRWVYVQSKVDMAEMYNESPYELLKRTIASCGATVLTNQFSVDKTFLNVALKYDIPERVESYVYGNLPQSLIDMFTDYDAFVTVKTRAVDRTFNMFDNKVVIGEGGGHSTHVKNNSSVDTVLYMEEGDDIFTLIDIDSYYPSMAIEFGWQSRASGDWSLYPKMLAKKRELSPLVKRGEGGETAARQVTAVKNIINAYTGALKNRYNNLFDPQQNVNICFTGQLLILGLANELHYKSKGVVKIIQANTDGLFIKFPKRLSTFVKERIKNWENITNLKFAGTRIKRMWQKNVNNYVMETADGKYKIKGAWLRHNDRPLNNRSFNIINKAIFEYLTKGTSIETTIRNERDPLLFFYTVKTGGTYDKTVLSIGRRTIDYGKVNRIYASRDRTNAGILLKVKGQSRSLVPNCPDFAKVHNTAVTCIPSDIDYSWYIDKARQQLNALVRVDL